jgi:hypothetical protein
MTLAREVLLQIQAYYVYLDLSLFHIELLSDVNGLVLIGRGR